MAAVLAQELPGLAHQVLAFPVTDAAGIGETTSYHQFGQKHFLTERDLTYFVRSYAGGHATDVVRLSPLRATNLTGVPPATVITVECDPLRAEGEACVRRLEAAGVPVVARRFDGQVHPFIVLGGMIDDANTARKWVGEQLRAALRN